MRWLTDFHCEDMRAPSCLGICDRTNCTRAAEQAIEAWLKRAGRKAQTDPTAREIATRTKDGA